MLGGERLRNGRRGGEAAGHDDLSERPAGRLLLGQRKLELLLGDVAAAYEQGAERLCSHAWSAVVRECRHSISICVGRSTYT